jgi:hypothetical protein
MRYIMEEVIHIEEMLTAREFALRENLAVRTVQQWAKRGEVIEAQKVGRYWVAPLSRWLESKQMERRTGPKNDPAT